MTWPTAIAHVIDSARQGGQGGQVGEFRYQTRPDPLRLAAANLLQSGAAWTSQLRPTGASLSMPYFFFDSYSTVLAQGHFLHGFVATPCSCLHVTVPSKPKSPKIIKSDTALSSSSHMFWRASHCQRESSTYCCSAIQTPSADTPPNVPTALTLHLA
jgi:hypothetical protein